LSLNAALRIAKIDMGVWVDEIKIMQTRGVRLYMSVPGL
jgi:hypothetical protein